jgi:hypothetical protein
MIEGEMNRWQTVTELLIAGSPLVDAAEADVKSLLTRSSKALAPLEDPLSTDYRRHRWLRFDREEAYSDWFAWILDELTSVQTICEVLGIDVTCAGADNQFIVEREVPVSFGHDGRRGRLDILLTSRGVCRAIVEIKITAADDSDYAKNRGYRRWLDPQTEFPCRKAVIVTNAGLEKDYEGFTHCGWKDVCLRLRRLVPDLVTQGRCPLAALILCFVGVVEQQLLKLEPITERKDRAVSREGCISTRRHLAISLNGAAQEDSNNPDSTRMQERFMDAGIRCYPQAMFALRDFRSMVLELARNVLQGKLSALGAAIGTPLIPGDIQDHINPDNLGQSDGRWAWLAAKIVLPAVGTGYFGLIWGGPTLTDPMDCRTVAMVLPLNVRREEILSTARSFPELVEQWSGSEISLTTVLNSEECVFNSAGGPSVFEIRLSDLIDRWTHILSRVKSRTS